MTSKEELNKLLMYFVHEHSNGLGLISNTLSLLKIMLERGQEITPEIIQKRIESLQIGKDRCRDAADYLYTQLKAKENEV
jgi:hypothetical protein